jgi:hypothetical protein
MMKDEVDAILSQIDHKPLLSLETFNLLNDGSTPSSSAMPLTVSVQGSLSSNQPHPTSGAGSSHFHTLTTDDDVEEAKNTDKNTSWAVNVWKQRSAHRRQVAMCFIQ